MPNFGHIFVQRVLGTKDGSKLSGNIQFGGMFTRIAYYLGLEAELSAYAPLGGQDLDLDALRQQSIIKTYGGGREPTVNVFLIRDMSHCYLPSPHFGGNHDEYHLWKLPKENIQREHLTPKEKRGRGETVEEEEEDYDDANEEQGEGRHEVRVPPPHSGAGSSSAPPHTHSFPPPPPYFDPTSVFPPSYFGSSSTPPAPPRDAFDLGPMYQMLGQLHAYRAEDRAFMEATRQEVDRQGRIIWHDHLGLVNSGLVRPFANHPDYPPVFDDPSAPYPPPHYPPPGDQ